MSGYTPVFGSLFKGSLCGQWPALAVFCTLLPLCDKNGHLDYSFAYLAATTGWPEELLRQGISALEQPDPASRSDADEGRRLIRLREHTDWGWRVVNHGLYREKARKAAFDAERVADGRNAERMKQRREDPTRPATTRANPPSDSDADTDKERLRSSSEVALATSSSERAPRTLSKSAEKRTELHSVVGQLANAKRMPI